MKRDIVYITLIILLLTTFAIRANTRESKWFYFEEVEHHGLHYGIWSNSNTAVGQFVVRCFEVDSVQAKTANVAVKPK